MGMTIDLRLLLHSNEISLSISDAVTGIKNIELC